jgi:hypothetical protein
MASVLSVDAPRVGAALIFPFQMPYFANYGLSMMYN